MKLVIQRVKHASCTIDGETVSKIDRGFMVLVGFGDGDNDKTMIENADIGVAMGNSVEELFELADYITSTVDNDGIYNALLKHNVVERMI